MATTIHGWEQVNTDRVLVKRFLGALVGGDESMLGDAVTRDCVVHRVTRGEDAIGPAAIAGMVEGQTLTDLSIELVETVAEDDRIAVYGTLTGQTTIPTRDGTRDVAPTGWRRELSHFGIYRLEDDRIAEAWLLDEPVVPTGPEAEESASGGSLGGRMAAWFRGE